LILIGINLLKCIIDYDKNTNTVRLYSAGVF